MPVPSYAIKGFTVIGVLVVAESINYVISDLFDDKVLGCVFFGVFIVICLIFRVGFLVFVVRDVVQPFCDQFTFVGEVF